MSLQKLLRQLQNYFLAYNFLLQLDFFLYFPEHVFIFEFLYVCVICYTTELQNENIILQIK